MRNHSHARASTLLVLSTLLNLQCSVSTQTSLRLEVRPSSAVTAYLLDIDPLDRELYNADPELKELAALMQARRREAYSLGPDVFLFLDRSRPVWGPHVVRSVETDADGAARLDNLKPGDYWLMAFSREQVRDALWLRHVIIKEGRNEAVLERGNALYLTPH